MLGSQAGTSEHYDFRKLQQHLVVLWSRDSAAGAARQNVLSGLIEELRPDVGGMPMQGGQIQIRRGRSMRAPTAGWVLTCLPACQGASEESGGAGANAGAPAADGGFM